MEHRDYLDRVLIWAIYDYVISISAYGSESNRVRCDIAPRLARERMPRQIPACFENRGFHSVRGINAILSDVIPNVFEILERGRTIQNTRLHSLGNLPAGPSLL